jgi:hypothetical protein
VKAFITTATAAVALYAYNLLRKAAKQQQHRQKLQELTININDFFFAFRVRILCKPQQSHMQCIRGAGKVLTTWKMQQN